MYIYFLSYLSFHFQSYFEEKKTDILLIKNIEDIKEKKEKLAYVLEMINLIEKIEQKNEKIKFIGFLINHKRVCVAEDCNCHSYNFDEF